MVSPEIKGIYASDLYDLEEYVPEDQECFSVPVRVMVGQRGSEGEESFDILVCSVKWLEERLAKDGFLFGRHYLFVPAFDGKKIKGLLTKMIEPHTSNTWTEVARKIGRLGLWEFEDYPDTDEKQHPSSLGAPEST
jgi:hypothetical protein